MSESTVNKSLNSGDGRSQRIAIELINLPFLRAGGSADEYRTGIERVIAKGWLWRHESRVYVRFTATGAELFA